MIATLMQLTVAIVLLVLVIYILFAYVLRLGK